MFRRSLRATTYFQSPITPLKSFKNPAPWKAMGDKADISISRSGGIFRKRYYQGGREPKRLRTQKLKPVKEGCSEEVLLADIRELLAAQKLEETAPEDKAPGSLSSGHTPLEASLPEPFSEIDVTVILISSTGDGLARSSSSNQVYVVPFTAAGDRVRVKVIKHFTDEHYSLADFLHVIEPSPLRDDSRINCKYFSSCSGCQFQMLDYKTQLEHKRSIVERAYKNFSSLPPELIPTIEHTIGSPLKYGYRTKLTPHFDGPPGYRSRTNRKNGIRTKFEETPDIGFLQKGKRKTIDIEDCPIGTDAVRMGMKRERLRLQDPEELAKYERGATILLRESTQRLDKGSKEEADIEVPPKAIASFYDTYTDLKTCVTNNNATTTEYIDSFTFTNPAGSFFQNNNSILSIFTQYIRENIIPPLESGSSMDLPSINYLIDAYCGSGLFTISLSSLFKSSVGIDISGPSIEFARKNAALNNMPPSRASFIAADAPELFKSVQYPANETVVVIDPPRKGCDQSFLSQLLKFAPKRVVYVSCNVHTQARDVGVLVKGEDSVGYKVESLRGFDFFPQTGHVEGVAVLSRIDEQISVAL